MDRTTCRTGYIGSMCEEYPAQYLEGLRLFNAEDFFESHEVLEELWSETQDERKKFYQGLIQAAVALLHFGNGNLGGAKKVYLTSPQIPGSIPARIRRARRGQVSRRHAILFSGTD